MNLRYAVLVVVLVLLGGFFYVWWTQGDLPVYVARVSSRLPQEKVPDSSQREPLSGRYSAHTTKEITIARLDGSLVTLPFAESTSVYRGIDQEATPATLADLQPDMMVVLAFNASSTIEAIYILQTQGI